MNEGYDYYHTDKLSKILEDARLVDKYGRGKYGKYIRIGFANRSVYRASRAFLEMLLKQHGDVSFLEAYDACAIPGKIKEEK